MALRHIDPPTMAANPAFSQGVLDEGTGTLYVGGQNGVDGTGALLDGFAEQTEQAYRNVLEVLSAVGYDQRNVARLAISVVGDADLREGFGAARAVWGDAPTAVTVLRVHGLARADALVEIEAVAHA